MWTSVIETRAAGRKWYDRRSRYRHSTATSRCKTSLRLVPVRNILIGMEIIGCWEQSYPLPRDTEVRHVMPRYPEADRVYTYLAHKWRDSDLEDPGYWTIYLATPRPVRAVLVGAPGQQEELRWTDSWLCKGPDELTDDPGDQPPGHRERVRALLASRVLPDQSTGILYRVMNIYGDAVHGHGIGDLAGFIARNVTSGEIWLRVITSESQSVEGQLQYEGLLGRLPTKPTPPAR